MAETDTQITLDELMAKDPLSYTSQDIEGISKILRERRAAWVTEELKAKASGKRPNPRAASKAASVQLSLSDLDI